MLTTDAAVVASERLLVALMPSAGASAVRDGELPADRTAVAVHVGTARIAGVVGRSGRDGIDLGDGEGSAILRLDRPVAVWPGDRFVVRRPSPIETLAGGRVLDPQPARGVARRRSTADRLRAIARAPAGSWAWRTARLELHGVLGGSPPAVAPDVAAAIDEALVAAVDREPGIHAAELVRGGVVEIRRRASLPGRSTDEADDLGRRIVGDRLEQLVQAGQLARRADRVVPAGAVVTGPSAELSAAMDRLVAALSSDRPPPLNLAARDAGCPPEGIRLLEAANRIVRLDDELAWAFPTYRALAARAVALAATNPLTPAVFRDATGTSRKFVMAILEDLDRRAILRRTPAGHVPGPRAPQTPAETPIGAEDVGAR